MYRPGRYRHQMANVQQLEAEADLVFQDLPSLCSLWESGEIGSAEFVACYVLNYALVRSSRKALGGPLFDFKTAVHESRGLEWLKVKFASSRAIERIDKYRSGLEVLSRISLKGVPRSVHQTLAMWANDQYPLDLMLHVPTPYEVLSLQTKGRRCVTVLVKREQLAQLVEGERDPFGFVLHDLIHADHFFSRPEMARGQIGFCRLMKPLVEAPFIQSLLVSDPVFRKEFEYGISDMNSNCVHLLKYLKAVFTGAILRKEGKSARDQLSSLGKVHLDELFSQTVLFWGIDSQLGKAFNSLNSPQESLEEIELLAKYLEQRGLGN